MAKGSLDGFIDMLVDAVAARLQTRIAGSARATPAPAAKAKAKKGYRAGRKLDMACRFPGCKDRSKGPRFSFLCEEHLKLPKKVREEALAKAKK